MSGGRPSPKPPRGWLTIAQAAELSGFTPQYVWRLASRGSITARRDEDGAWTVARRDVAALKHRGPAAGPRVAVMSRPVRARHEAWQSQANIDHPDPDRDPNDPDDNFPVSTWLGELADRRSGYRGE